MIYVIMNCNHMVSVLNGKDFVRLMNGFGAFVNGNIKNGRASPIFCKVIIAMGQNCVFAFKGLACSGKSRRFVMLKTFMITFATLQALAAAFRNPGSVRAVTSIAKNPKALPMKVKVPAGILQFIIVGFHLYGHWLQNASVVCYGMDLVATIRKIHAKCFRKGRYLLYARQRRALDILQAHFSQLYSTYMLGLEMFAITTVVLNLYMAVEFHSGRPLVMAMGSTVTYWWGMLEFAWVYETSREVMTAWKRSQHVQDSLWFRKFLRSCKPIRIPLGSFFYIDRGVVLTIMSIIVNSSASLILAN